jgi:hypothetical protein
LRDHPHRPVLNGCSARIRINRRQTQDSRALFDQFCRPGQALVDFEFSSVTHRNHTAEKLDGQIQRLRFCRLSG